METWQEIIQKNRVGYCLECGKCSAVCPITLWGVHGYNSPRLFVENAIQGQINSLLDDELFWSCLTCKRCSEICPSDVSFSEFIRDLRAIGRSYGKSGKCTHNGVIQSWIQSMTKPDLRQQRLDWLTPDLKVSDHSDTLYFVGCLPYYDSLFEGIGFEGVKIAQSAIKIMNTLGIEPQVLADERCCGHDQLWQGDLDTFRALAVLNLELLETTGAKRIITTCPECARTLKVDYPYFVRNHNIEVLHIAELLAESNLSLQHGRRHGHEHCNQSLSRSDQSLAQTMTYQDPCRLGRHLGVYDAPRKILADLGLKLVEMEHNRQSSLCCGTSCWTSCGVTSKNIQVERLSEAKDTTAEVLVTTCLKCQIHFKCAQSDPAMQEKLRIKIIDLSTLVAEFLS